MIAYAFKALIHQDENGALLYLPSESDHTEARTWLIDNGITFRETSTITPSFNSGYDTIPCFEIGCPAAATAAKLRWV